MKPFFNALAFSWAALLLLLQWTRARCQCVRYPHRLPFLFFPDFACSRVTDEIVRTQISLMFVNLLFVVSPCCWRSAAGCKRSASASFTTRQVRIFYLQGLLIYPPWLFHGPCWSSKIRFVSGKCPLLQGWFSSLCRVVVATTILLQLWDNVVFFMHFWCFGRSVFVYDI